MSLLNLPAFTILADWADQVLETLEWKTAVLQAIRQGPDGTAAEQRRMLRLSPRRSLDLNLVLFREERTYFDLLIHAAGASDFYVPLCHQVDVLRAPVASGATYIPLSRPYSELPPLGGSAGPGLTGGPCMLIGGDFRTYEVFEAGYVYDDTGSPYGPNGLYIITDGGLVNDWPKGARLFPAMQAKIATQPQWSEVTSIARTGAIRFTSVGPQDWTSTGQEGFDSYKGFPVMVREPNRVDDLAGSFLRNINTTDNDTGLWVYTDVSGRGFGTQTHTWFPVGRKEHSAVRDMLYFLRGQLTGFWLPTFSQDFSLAADATPDQSILTIKYVGYSDLGFPVEGRDTVVIFMDDGSRVYCRITSAAVDGDTEILSLESPLGVYLTDSLVRKISFMQYSRFAQDTIEIAHMTDNQGVSTISANITAISYDRNAPNWDPPGPVNPDPLSGGCGFIPSLFLSNSYGDCGSIAIPYGFSSTEMDEDPPPDDNIDHIHTTLTTDGGVTYRWAFARTSFTELWGFIRDELCIVNNRTSDRTGMPYSVDYDLSFFTDTNALASNSFGTSIQPGIGNQVAPQGCHSVSGWVPGVNLMGVNVTVNKAGAGIGAGNQDYTFGVTLVAAGTNHNFGFANIDDQPVAGTIFKFHVSIRCDGAGSVRFIVTSTTHGTAIDQTYTAPESVSLFNFSLYNRLQTVGRASNPDMDVLENVVIMDGVSIET